MSDIVHIVRDLIMEMVPTDGSRVGNQTLLSKVRERAPAVDQSQYHAAKDQLVGEGFLAKGRGRGGSVYLRSKARLEYAPRASTTDLSKPKAETTKTGSGAAAYAHGDEAVQRPDQGVEAQFTRRKPPRIYRYDSSLAPELTWDENPDRALAEWLLHIVAEIAEKGEMTVFAEPLGLAGHGRTLHIALAMC